MNIGDKLLFGTYEWRVLEIKGDKALILTEEIIELRDYHNRSTDITWKDYELRKFLNGEFYDKFNPCFLNFAKVCILFLVGFEIASWKQIIPFFWWMPSISR